MKQEIFRHYMIHVDEIDQCHLHLLNWMLALSRQDPDARPLSELVDALQEHMTDEETFMAQIEFPYLSHHAGVHRTIMHQVKTHVDTGYTRYFGVFAYKLFLDHIDQMDSQIGSFVMLLDR